MFEDNLFFEKWELRLQFFKDFENIPFLKKEMQGWFYQTPLNIL